MSRKSSHEDNHVGYSSQRGHVSRSSQHTQQQQQQLHRASARPPYSSQRSASALQRGHKHHHQQHDSGAANQSRHRIRRREEDSDKESDEGDADEGHRSNGHRHAVRRPRTESSDTSAAAPHASPSSASSSPSLSSLSTSPAAVQAQLPPNCAAACVLPLDAKLIELLYALSPTSGDRDAKLRVIDAVRRTLQRIGLHTEIYGSLCTGVVIPASDVDCVMLRSTDTHTAANLSPKLSSALLSLSAAATGSATNREVRTALSGGIRVVGTRLRTDPAFTNVLFIAHAKVPIVKCRHRTEGVKVDLSFEKDGCVSSNYLCELFCEPGNELARPLIVLVKALVNNCGLDDPSVGGLGSFPISLLVLWYLKQCVPSRYSAELQRSIAALLVGFLKYYSSEFDHRRQGIDYVQQRTFAKAPADDLFIANPLRPGTNCARAATLYTSRVVPCFHRAFEALSPLLSTTAAPHEMERHLLQLYVDALPGMREWREVSAAASRGSHLPQNMWDQSTNLYMGGVL